MGYLPNWMPERVRLPLRGLEFQLYRWGGSNPHPVVLLHGWGDTAETWQFVADSLSRGRTYVALDMRGFGRTQHPQDGYWFPDYLADLDALLDSLGVDSPLDIVGHSMGANIAMLYAGVRPARVRRLVNLEGFGLPRTEPAQAPARYAQWLDQVRTPAQFSSYENYGQFIEVLARRNPRTSPERLDFIARAWARPHNGRIELWADPKHKHVNPVLYQRDQAEACWRAITAPMLIVVGGKSPLPQQLGIDLDAELARGLFQDARVVRVEEAGHMLHHEQPEAVAQLIDAFLSE